MNISDVRAKFPEYNDLSDDALAKGVHKKFYSDMPYSDFSSKLGMNVNTDIPTMSTYNRTWGEAAKQGLASFPEATMNMAKDTFEAVSHPYDTAAALGNLGVGMVQKRLIPGDQGKESYADAFDDFYVDRLGSADKIKKTLATDMPGLLGDASMVLSGGGGTVAKVGAIPKLGKAGNIAAQAGKAIKATGDFIDPVNLALKQPVTLGAASMSPMARKLYTGSMKGSVANLTPDQKTSLFRTAVENRVPVSGKGLKRVKGLKDEAALALDKVYDRGEAEGFTIDRNQITDSLVDLHGEAANTAKPMTNQKAVEKQWAQTEFHPEQIPVKDARKIKTSANEVIYDRSAKRKLKSYQDKALKATVDSIRDQTHKRFPELDKLDPDYGELADLHKAIEHAVSRIDNHNLVAPTSVMTTGAAAIVDPILAAPTLVTSMVAKAPSVTSALAIALMRARGGDARKMKMSPLRQGLYQADAVNQIRTTKDEEGNIKKVGVE